MRWFASFLIIPLLLLLPARADAVTVRDIVELTHAGLGEDVLLALIDVDRSIFPIDAATIKELKAQGVSERVILAMVRSGRETPPPEPMVSDAPAPAAAPDPQVIVIDHHDPEIREVPVAVPVYIPVATTTGTFARARRVDQRHSDFLGSMGRGAHPRTIDAGPKDGTRILGIWWKASTGRMEAGAGSIGQQETELTPRSITRRRDRELPRR